MNRKICVCVYIHILILCIYNMHVHIYIFTIMRWRRTKKIFWIIQKFSSYLMEKQHVLKSDRLQDVLWIFVFQKCKWGSWFEYNKYKVGSDLHFIILMSSKAKRRKNRSTNSSQAQAHHQVTPAGREAQWREWGNVPWGGKGAWVQWLQRAEPADTPLDVCDTP